MRCGGFELIVGVLKQVLGIEWRNEKDDAVLHQILLCLKALSTTEVHSLFTGERGRINGRLDYVNLQLHQQHYSHF